MQYIYRTVNIIILLISISVTAQNIRFEPVNTNCSFLGVSKPTIKFTDFDFSSSTDIVISGVTRTSNHSIKFYNNHFFGQFEIDPVFINNNQTNYYTMDFADVNGDGFDDLLQYQHFSNNYEVVLYLNDGYGNMIEVPNTNFIHNQVSNIVFQDIDNDGDADVLITSSNVSKIYQNDGQGNFTELTQTNLISVSYSGVAFADIDNDNDADLLITGRDTNFHPITKLYKNDGSGHFSAVNNSSIMAVFSSGVDFADIDNDQDLDLVITGKNTSAIAKIYINDGAGNFSESTSNILTGVYNGNPIFTDIDNDLDMDLIITGDNDLFSSESTKIYTNNGSGQFTEQSNQQLIALYDSQVAASDLDNDGDMDIVIAGIHNGTTITKLYFNDGNGNFTDMSLFQIEGVANSAENYTIDTPTNTSVAFADIDYDGDQDLLITGINLSQEPICKVYMNDGSGNFTENTSANLPAVDYASINLSDIDNDHFPELIISGMDAQDHVITKLFENTNGNFIENTQVNFTQIYNGKVSFENISGQSDIFLAGNLTFNTYNASLFAYTGSGYNNQTLSNMTISESPTYDFADIDNDGDQDLLISAANIKIYLNVNGILSERPSNAFTGKAYSIDFVDLDGDNDQDVVINGIDSNLVTYLKFYQNDGNGNFSEISHNLPAFAHASISFADVDNDNDPDMLITGSIYLGQSVVVSKLYENDGQGNFLEVGNLPFVGIVNGASTAFADIDGDNDKDLIITGYDENYFPISILYKNISYILDVKEQNTDKIDIYPNPTAEYLIVQDDDNQIDTIEIYDALGQKVKTATQINNPIPLNLSKGVYIVKMHSLNRCIKSCKLLIK